NYRNAIKLYKEAYKKEKSLHVTERLAESYSLTQDYVAAESWYALLIKMEGAEPVATLKYAEALRNNAKYNEAKVQFNVYADKQSDVSSQQRSLWSLSCDSAMYWMKNPKSVTIANQKNLNSIQSEWGTALYNHMVVFASDRSNLTANDQKTDRPFLRFAGWEAPSRTSYNWTGNGYLSLYSVNSKTEAIQKFPINVGTDYHVGPASFTANGTEVYFTLTRIPKKLEYQNVGKEKISTINTELYYSKMENDGTWSVPVPFKYNDVNKHSVGDPFITKDGKRLYFVSNMSGGFGGTDIYAVDKTNNDDWGIPINLKDINTPSNERTPSIADSNVFYFATEGNIGMGGLDIFSAKISGNQISNIQNMGYPTNSPQDDFAFTATGKLTGFLSSNRIGGLGSDDIYSFLAKEIIVEKPVFALQGKVLNKETNQPIKAAVVQLTKVNGTTVNTISDETGNFKFNLAEQSAYNVSAEKMGYIKTTGSAASTIGLTQSTVLTRDLFLDEIVIGKAIRIDNIFYDFDKFNIRPDAALELDKLVTTLKENPTIWIELGSHTDSRGNDVYNQKLSQNRATAAVNYIISKGIAKERITAKGYGETMLVNGCRNGVKCTEEEHQQNRRTEFKIVKQ
ncbi:MAG: flagellar motor protein MotB, partial [Flavobacteriales bacterium]